MADRHRLMFPRLHYAFHTHTHTHTHKVRPTSTFTPHILHELPKRSLTGQAMYYNVTSRRFSVTIVEAEK